MTCNIPGKLKTINKMLYSLIFLIVLGRIIESISDRKLDYFNSSSLPKNNNSEKMTTTKIFYNM